MLFLATWCYNDTFLHVYISKSWIFYFIFLSQNVFVHKCAAYTTVGSEMKSTDIGLYLIIFRDPVGSFHEVSFDLKELHFYNYKKALSSAYAISLTQMVGIKYFSTIQLL